MPDRYTNDTYDFDRRDFRRRDDDRDDFPPLPWWLESKLLAPGEEVEWVRGPRLNPPWERYVTHPALVLLALAVGALCVAAFALLGRGPDAGWVGIVAGGVVVVGALLVVAFFTGFFTRLIVTNRRVAIMQGYEVVRSWDMDQLPRSMIRYRAGEGGERDPSIDLATVKTMLGGSPDGFADQKTIMAFSKQLNSIIKGRDDKPR